MDPRTSGGPAREGGATAETSWSWRTAATFGGGFLRETDQGSRPGENPGYGPALHRTRDAEQAVPPLRQTVRCDRDRVPNVNPGKPLPSTTSVPMRAA